MLRSILLMMLAVGLVQPALAAADNVHPEMAESVFYVAWYDVGKSALDGLKGVKKVTSGFRGFKEINTVTYDPDIITIEQMVESLKKTGTYRGTVE